MFALAVGGIAAGQQRVLGPPIRWRPERPQEGSLVAVRVAAPWASVRGVAAGEPLHFAAAPGDSDCWALAPIPLGSGDTVVAHIVLSRADGSEDTVTLRIAVIRRVVDTQFLQTPAAFATPPDSALASRIAAERDSARAVRRRSHLNPRFWVEPFRRPVAGRVTTPFGQWRVWGKTVEGRHDGVDLASAKGVPVRAASRGVIALVARQYYGGLTVLIDHGAGLVTSYQHLSAASVAVGDTVASGQVIGRVGATGRVTGPHLHWGASYGTITVDPFVLLDPELAP